jgi:sorbitol/mannitol transport system permease protein
MSTTATARRIRFRRTPPAAADRYTRPITRLVLGLITWVLVLVLFFPVFWMALTGFKREADANTSTPHFIFTPTLAEYKAVWQGPNSVRPFIEHSVVISVVSTLLVIVIALPAAYALSIRPVPKWRDVLFFFISTKMLPIVGAIIPLFVIARDIHLLDTQKLMVILYLAMNLPIAVWMLRSFLLEVPIEVIEASRVDGAGLLRQLRTIIIPIVRPGLAATALICFIFAWNEFFLVVNLTTTQAATVPVFLVGFVAPEGQFLAHLSAAATIACLPVLIAGWVAQDKLVRGLSMGAVK